MSAQNLDKAAQQIATAAFDALSLGDYEIELIAERTRRSSFGSSWHAVRDEKIIARCTVWLDADGLESAFEPTRAYLETTETRPNQPTGAEG
jgi:hypothetical protein